MIEIWHKTTIKWHPNPSSAHGDFHKQNSIFLIEEQILKYISQNRKFICGETDREPKEMKINK